MRRWLRFVAPFLLALAFCAPGVKAQFMPGPNAPPAEAEKPERSPPALPYAFAVIYVLLVMTIVCKPSRKT